MNNPNDERKLFETWLRTEHPSRWPNPSPSGDRVDGNGNYYHKQTQLMWEAWQAAVESVVHGVLT